MTATSTSLEKLWQLRPGKLSDHHLVYESWKLNHRKRAFGQHVDAQAYSRGMDWLIRQLLERCALYIAGYDRDPDYIMGWSVTSTGCVHYVWIRPEYRGKGVAKDLLAPYIDKPTIYTHPVNERAKGMRDRWDVPKGWIYDPFHAWRIASYPKATNA